MLGFTASFVRHCLKLAKSCGLSVSSTSSQKILCFPKYLDFLCSWHYYGVILYLGWTIYVPIYSTGSIFVSFLIKNSDFWPQNLWTSDPGGTLYKTACVSKYEGIHCRHFCCLLTLHRLDSNFEDRFLLSQQPLHHGAKFAWRNKLKHKHILDAVCNNATMIKCFIQQQRVFIQ